MPFVKFPSLVLFTNIHISQFSYDFFNLLESQKTLTKSNQEKDKLIFKINSFEWISIEALTLLTSIFYKLKNDDVPFKILLRLDDRDNFDKNIKAFIVNNYLLSTWNILQFINLENSDAFIKELKQYTDLDNLEKYIKESKLNFESRLPYSNEDNSTYNQRIKLLNQGSLDFKNASALKTSLIIWDKVLNDKFKNLNENILGSELNTCLTEANIDDLIADNLNEYFIKGTLKNIITKELIENSIFHAFPGIDRTETFTSIGHRKSNTLETIEIQQDEKIKHFFKEYQPYIEFNSLDFGEGISKSLRSQYAINNPNGTIKDSDVIEYAFETHSSKNPFLDSDSSSTFQEIPRGLSDVLNVIQYYSGILIVRSGFGKVIFDCTNQERKIHKSDNERFDGTFFTIFLPRCKTNNLAKNNINESKNFDLTGKKVHFEFVNLGYISNFLFKSQFENHTLKIDQQIEVFKIINNHLKKIKNKFQLYDEIYKKTVIIRHVILVIDFSGFEIGNSEINSTDLNRKILNFFSKGKFFDGTEGISVICINQYQAELKLINELVKADIVTTNQIAYHPVPCFFNDNSEVDIIGVFDDNEKQLLINLLNYNEHYLSFSDIQNGHLNTTLGNIVYRIHKDFRIIEGIKVDQIKNQFKTNSIKKLIENAQSNKEKQIYITAGNYLQTEFISILDILNSNEKYGLINLFFHKIIKTKSFNDAVKGQLIGIKKEIIFIAITLTSHKLAEEIIKKIENDSQNRIKISLVKLSNYHTFSEEKDFLNINKEAFVFFICDVIASGGLNLRVKNELEKNGIELLHIFSIFDTRKIENLSSDKNEIYKPKYIHKLNDVISLDEILQLEKKLVSSVFPFPMDLLKIEFLDQIVKAKTSEKHEINIKRISPFTNTIITEESSRNNNVLISDIEKEFPDVVEFLTINYLKIKKVFHTYYFETALLFQNPKGKKLIFDLLKSLSGRINYVKFNYLLYPKESGIENFDFDCLYCQNFIFDNDLEIIEIIREDSEDGWKYLNKEICLKKQEEHILILDDGSCTGSTIVQIIESLNFSNSSGIDIKINLIILSIFGRLSDHNKNFYTYINKINLGGIEINVSIYFGMQFFINTYYTHSFEFILDEYKVLESEQQLPQYLQNYVEFRKKEILLIFENTDRKNHSFIKSLDSDSKFSLLKLLKWRNELGKLNGFKFYYDDFQEFDKITKDFSLYSNFENRNFCESLQYILAVIYHERFFKDIVKRILPDIFLIIEDFLQKWLIGEIKSDYLFDWINHQKLYFMIEVYGISKLINQGNQDFLIKNTTIDQNSFSHFFYKLKSETNINKRVLIDNLKEFYTSNEFSLIFNEYLLYEAFVYLQNPILTIYDDDDDFDLISTKLKQDLDKDYQFGDHKSTLDKEIYILIDKFKNFEIDHNLIDFEHNLINVRFGLIDNLFKLNKLFDLWGNIKNDKVQIFIKKDNTLSLINTIENLTFIQNSLNSIDKEEIRQIKNILIEYNDIIFKKTSYVSKVLKSYSKINLVRCLTKKIAEHNMNNHYFRYVIYFSNSNSIINYDYLINFHEVIFFEEILSEVFRNAIFYSKEDHVLKFKIFKKDGNTYLYQSNIFKENIERNSFKKGLSTIKNILNLYGYEIFTRRRNKIFQLIIKF
jgi:hypothetical protein